MHLQCRPTVNYPAHTCNIAPTSPTEKDNDIRHFLLQRDPTHWNRFVDTFSESWAPVECSIHHGGLHPRGTDRINSDSVWRVVKCYRSCQLTDQHLVFGGRDCLPAFLVIPIKACLADVYCTIPNVGTKELQDATLMITPRPRSRGPVRPRQCRGICCFMTLLTALTKSREPLTLTLKKDSNSETSASAISAGRCTPICTRAAVSLYSY